MMARSLPFLPALFACMLISTVHAYLPIVFMHGVNGSPHDFDGLRQYIAEHHPGTAMFALDVDAKEESLFKSMDAQVKDFVAALREVTSVNITGPYHLVAHSQGTLVSRGGIEEMSDHRVQKYITLAGPQQGQYGIPPMVENIVPGVTRDFAHDVFYNAIAQDCFSIAGYWNDPRYHDTYLKEVVFLPHYNNEVNTSDSARYKENFLRIKEMVALGSDGDDIINPWFSSTLDFYTYEEDFTHIDMTQTIVYKEDLYGLQSLDKRGSLSRQMVAGLTHTDWLRKDEAFAAVLSYLD
uniref:palmitoyl-CoA hydrolase n=1 Tax=Palpitomonas bilix TaxID=652834 RepID=A0A7S3DL04_9EUKA|mmetsp:Transcript_4218/g.8339  ORF Transcript_4218/g.8339 Transcript_4218/m.8339 type:complete len:295 (+) Transcript_4218:1374-2258(+)